MYVCMVTRSFLSIIEHVSDANRRDFLVPLCFISYYRDFVSLVPPPPLCSLLLLFFSFLVPPRSVGFAGVFVGCLDIYPAAL